MKDFVSKIPAGAKVLVVFNGFSENLDAGTDYRMCINELLQRDDLRVMLVASGGWAFPHIVQRLGVAVPWDKTVVPSVESFPSRILYSHESYCDGLSFSRPVVRLTGTEVRRIIEFYPPLIKMLNAA